RQAAAAAERLAGRLEQRPRVVAALEAAREAVAGSQRRVDELLLAVREVRFDGHAQEEAQAKEAAARRAAEAAQKAAAEADREVVRAKERADAAARRLSDAKGHRAELERLSGEASLLGRISELLMGFRNAMVAAVGPRLAEQASDLFGELTDHEYDHLSVDAEDFALQISDAGRSYGMERFSGSETDLANLALRVAISEHIRFQSGGSVGLLVLDEVFGPLDEERKTRMLLALERLRGRFRQVLVVTHDLGVKEQLPNAIEVVKRPGRRATARLMAS
ncbi:MAG: SbcC/MukB-like Walker B domain-containing protein, partial [Acidimicrobiales bacterium]